MPFNTDITWVVSKTIGKGNPVGNPTQTPPEGPANTAMYQILENTLDNQARIVALEGEGTELGPGSFNPNLALKTAPDGSLTESIVTDTELEYLDGATSNIQAQLDSIESNTTGGGDASSAHNHNSRYYTKTNLQTSGQSNVHWDNVTNEPSTVTQKGLSSMRVFTFSTTWTIPAGVTVIKTTIIGAGSGAHEIDPTTNVPTGGSGGGGIIAYWDVLPGWTVIIEVGAGGSPVFAPNPAFPDIIGGNSLITIVQSGGGAFAAGGFIFGSNSNDPVTLGSGGGVLDSTGLRGDATPFYGQERKFGQNPLNRPFLYGGEGGLMSSRQVSTTLPNVYGLGGHISPIPGVVIVGSGSRGVVIIEY